MKSVSFSLSAIGVLALLAGCVSTNGEDPTKNMVFMSREIVEDMSDDAIQVNGDSAMSEMKKQRKLTIAVKVDISNQWAPDAAPPYPEKLITSAQTYVRSYLANVKGYRLEALSGEDFNKTMKTSDDVGGIVFPFKVDLKLILNTRKTAKFTEDIWDYSCTLEWELIDNRTTINGLGDLQTPQVVESMICKYSVPLHEKLSVRTTQVAGSAFGDLKQKNAQDAFNVAIGNCMSQFYAQLANRVPFGGVVAGMKTLDGDVYFTIKADAKGQGVVKKMQMLILTEELDRVAVGEVLVSANGKSNIKVWRWLSPSYKAKIKDVASKDKDATDNWLDENPLVALCMGLPEPSKDVLLDFRTHK